MLAAEYMYTVHKMSISLGISLHIYILRMSCLYNIFTVPESLMLLHHLVYMYKYTGV